MMSGGNRNPANADFAGSHGSGRVDDFTVQVCLDLANAQRNGAVARLQLEDIDWRNGELAVTGKGQRTERLPLPTDVGEAIVAYLTSWRPKTSARQVFLCVHAPHGAMSRNTVTNVV